MNSGEGAQGGERRKKHSPFVSVQRALRCSPYGGLEVGVRERLEEGVGGGVKVSVRGGVEEGVRIPRLGVSDDVPALGQQAEGDEEEEDEGTHFTDLWHL